MSEREDGSIQWPPPGGAMNEQQFEAFARGDHLRFIDADGNEVPVTFGSMSGSSLGWDGSLTFFQERADGSREETVVVPARRHRVTWTARILTDAGVSAVTGTARTQDRAEQAAADALDALRAGEG